MPMKAVVWRGNDLLALEDIPEPEKEDSVVVQVHFTGICGSDITIDSGKHPRAKVPLGCCGHEFIGETDLPVKKKDTNRIFLLRFRDILESQEIISSPDNSFHRHSTVISRKPCKGRWSVHDPV